MDRIILKMEAKNLVKGHLWTLLKPVLIVGVISYTISFIFAMLAMVGIGFDVLGGYSIEEAVQLVRNSKMMTIGSYVSTLVSAPLLYGQVLYYNQFINENYADLNIIIKPFKYIFKIFVITLFINILVSIGSMFLVIPGFILACAFSVVPYVYMKHPELGVMDMVMHAWRMMNGHKMEYFILELSFIGWHFLGAITCGIAYIWIMPYYHMTLVKYFNYIDDCYRGNIPETIVYDNIFES